MAYEVLARKWRPRQFDDVVGQEHVIATLRNAIKTDRVAHAYLFVGPRGVGKTTIARIFARALNCVKGPAERACGECDSCREISGGTNLDVQEIDGASNRRIEDVRDLRDNARFAPMGRFKIYIIDEVHMLTTEAFNALLKILEEPPPHVKFFMATTDPQKIPATILSRCQRFDLRRIPVRLILERLELITDSEKIKAERDALLAVARAAEGGLRDAESALDQLISFQGKDIKESDVLAVFGLVSREALETLADALLSGDVLQTVKLVTDLDAQGKDMQRLLVELLEYFRNLLVFVEVGAEAAALDLTDTQLEALQRQSDRADAPRLLRMIEILMDTVDRLRYALSKRTLVETALIRCARLADAVSLDAILDQINAVKRQLGTMPAVSASAEPSRARDTPANRSFRPESGPPASAELKLNPPPPPPPEPAEVELDKLRADWHVIMERVGRTAIRARNHLLDAAPLSVAADKVVIGVDQEFEDRLEVLLQARNSMAVRKALEMTLRRPVTVEFTVVTGLKVPAAQPSEGESGAPATGSPQNPGGSAMRKWMEDDKVQKMLDTFNGSIVEIRE